ncbi:MAG: hypothetical protein ACO2Y5_05180 [Nitrosopumilaceae archaeon]
MVLADKTLEEILNYLDQSVTKLAKDTMSNAEFHMDENSLKEFLFSQYDIRLDNLLQRKDSNIHHLESSMKNKIIQKKQRLVEQILREFKV